jgi:hypothetical protein
MSAINLTGRFIDNTLLIVSILGNLFETILLEYLAVLIEFEISLTRDRPSTTKK